MTAGLSPAGLRAAGGRSTPALPRPDDGRRMPGLYRGWHVVAGAFLVTLVGYGAIYSYSAFAEEIAASFGASRVSVATVFVLSGSTCFFVSAISGALADRVGARPLAAAGMVLVGVGLAVAATARTLIEVYVGYGLLTGLGCGFAYVPALAAVQRWFTTHRGLASGLAVSGVGVGTALVPPMAETLSGFGDWRTTFLVCGALAVVVGLAGAALLHPSPLRWVPPGGAAPVLRSRSFALAYGGTLLVSVTVTLPYALLVETARDLGVARQDAVALLGLIGLGSLAGRFVLAALADVVGRRVTFLGCCTGLAITMGVWGFAESLAVLQGFAFTFGALHGGLVALLPAVVADRFGAGSVGGVLGTLYTSRGIAQITAPPALAAGIATLAGHALPLLAVALLALLGTAMLAAMGRAPR